MRWEWLPQYLPLLAQGLYITLLLLVISVVAGFLLAIPIGLAQVTGPKSPRDLAQGFCTFIRGTPLLVQLYLLYYGVGSLFPILGSAFPALGLLRYWRFGYFEGQWSD